MLKTAQAGLSGLAGAAGAEVVGSAVRILKNRHLFREGPKIGAEGGLGGELLLNLGAAGSLVAAKNAIGRELGIKVGDLVKNNQCVE